MEPAALLETPIGEPAEGSVQWECVSNRCRGPGDALSP